MNDLKKIAKAKADYEKAAKRLTESMRANLPQGSVVTVESGRSRFPAQVIRAGGCWWSNPDAVRVMNLDTGKIRDIGFSNIVSQ